MKKVVLLIPLSVLLIFALIMVWPGGDHKPSQQKGKPLLASRGSNASPPIIDKTALGDSTSVALPAPKLGTPSSHDQMTFSPSLRGTDIDGRLKVGADNKLVLDQGVRDFFDYFLSASDELGPEAAIGEIQRYIDTYLPSEAGQHAHQLLANYLRYKQFEFGLQSQSLVGKSGIDIDALDVLRSSFQSLKQKKSELFSESESQALFGLEEAYQDYTLATLELFSDDALSDEQRQAKIDQLERDLPPKLQSSRSDDARHRQEQASIVSLSQNLKDDAEYHQALRSRGLSQHKADELVSHRQQQQQFEDIYQRYRRSAAQLDVEEDGYTQSLKDLRRSFFTNPEQHTRARLRDLSVKN